MKRIEHDFLGNMEIDDSKYYGVQTTRAFSNFQISGIAISRYRFLIKALGYIKKSCAKANLKFGILDADKATAIFKACDEVIEGKFDDQFTIDIIQGGAGTSVNMNANEVIANRALEIAGRKKGDYDYIHPNNHINLSQSTNDVYPTALHLAIIEYSRLLEKEMDEFRLCLIRKSDEFRDVVKMGRTQLQDAVPMTLGQEFKAWSEMLNNDIKRLITARELMYDINLGGTAIGTGINAPKGFSEEVIKILAEETSIPLFRANDLIEATQDCGSYIQYSGMLKRIAAKVSKISNDLRLLSSGPRTGFNEINLPARQPGSSIMPGKVNPVIPEVVNQVAFEVIGNDVTITLAAEAGQLELNAMEPIIAYKIFSSLIHLRNAINTLRINCVEGITANKQRCRELVENSIGLVTVLAPLIGYEKSSQIAREALDSGKSVYEIALEKKYFSEKELKQLLSADSMF